MISNHPKQTVFSLLLLGLLPILASSSSLRSGGRRAQQCGAATPTDRTAFVILEVVSDDDTKAIFNKTDAVAVNTTFVSSYKDTAQCSKPAVRSVPSATLVRAVELEEADTVAARTRQATLFPTGDFTWLVEVVLSCNACDDDAKLFSSAQDDEDGSSRNPIVNIGYKLGLLVNDVDATSLCSCTGPSKTAFLDSFSKELESKLNNVAVVAATEVPVLSDEVCYGSALTAGLPDGTTRQAPLLTTYSYTGVCAGRNIEVIKPAKSESPSASPVSEPTSSPTESPTESPTDEPTDAPTDAPTESPTESPTEAPVSPTLPPAAENYEVFVYSIP